MLFITPAKTSTCGHYLISAVKIKPCLLWKSARWDSQKCFRVICPSVKDALTQLLSSFDQSGFSLHSCFCFSWMSLCRTEVIHHALWVSVVWLLWTRVTMCSEEWVSFSWMENHSKPQGASRTLVNTQVNSWHPPSSVGKCRKRKELRGNLNNTLKGKIKSVSFSDTSVLYVARILFVYIFFWFLSNNVYSKAELQNVLFKSS